MKTYEKLTKEKMQSMANDKQVTITDIMMWYKDAECTQERVDMIMLMKERVKVCNTKKTVW